jgi:hypothetical protein
MNGVLATKGVKHKVHQLVNNRPKCGARGRGIKPDIQPDWFAQVNCKRCQPPPKVVLNYEI